MESRRSAPMTGSQATLLVPTEQHVEALTTAGQSAQTARKLIRALSEAELPDQAPTTPEMTRLLTSRLLEIPVSHAAAVDEAVGRLRRAGTRSSTLRATRLPRAERFADLLDAANRTLAERSLRDDRDAPWAAAAHLRSGRGLDPVAPEIVIRGLTRWDAATLTFVESLHRRLRAEGGPGVTLELPDLTVAPLKSALDALATELEARWAEHNDAPGLSIVASAALDPDRLRLVEAQDAASEARAAARAVLEALQAGARLERIAVVPVDLAEAFLEPLRFELTQARIPFVEPRGRPAIAAPRAHAALELLRLARGPLNRDSLVDFLRLPGLRLGSWFDDPRRLGEVLHEVQSLPIRVERAPGELLLDLGNRVAMAERSEPERCGQLWGVRDALGRWLDQLSLLAQPAPRNTHATRARGLFDQLGLFEPAPSTLSRALARAQRGARELLRALGYDAVAAKAMQTAIDRTTGAALALGAQDEPITLNDWLEELELALSGVAPTGGAARAAAVRVARPDDVAALDLDLVVLCRATDASLDRGSPPDNVLGLELESALPKSERPLPSALEQHFGTFAVASALSRARRVVVTWARSEENSTTAPSRLARALARDGKLRREPASPLSPGAHRAVAPRPQSSEAARRVRVEQTHLAFYANPSAPIDPYNGDAGSLEAFLGGLREKPVAVTAVERGLRCHFLAFASSVLKANRLDLAGEAIGSREHGSLQHEALAAALEAVQPLWAVLPASELLERALGAARDLLESKGRSLLRRAGLANTLADVRSLLNWIFSQDDGMVFRYAERAFGENQEWAPLQLQQALLSGRVDRIDTSSDGRRVRVIDYKTRIPKAGDEPLMLQPWLYAQKVGVELGAEQVEFCFLALEKRNPKQRVVYQGPVDGEPILEAKNKAEKVLLALRTGCVPARPASAAFCPRCEARDICRRPLSAPEGSEP